MAEVSTGTQPDPREIARLCRRMASIPTSGGHRTDRVLLELAEELESKERESAAPEIRPGENKG
jgi:hypothetical protein